MVLDLKPSQYKILKNSPKGAEVCVNDMGSLAKEDLALGIAVGGTFGLMLLVGGKIIGTALVLSIATIGSATVLYIKLPSRMDEMFVTRTIIKNLPLPKEKRQQMLSWDWKKAMERHEIAADVIISVGAVFVFGTTLSGLLSATITGLGFSTMLRFANTFKRVRANMNHTRGSRRHHEQRRYSW